ncbi:MAG TPA: rhodanese-like domain-containing protein [Thermoanaerobaculia bacterium]|nr:rhodanese-like domain-containing protein [Thermoanaerobaculia bacterium]
MTIGGLLVLGLVAWALMRSFQAPVAPPAPPQTALTSATATAPEPQHVQDAAHAAVPRISPEELRQKIGKGEVTVIDVRDADAYLAAHIPGSLHIPFGRIEGEIPYLPREKPIVTYCT